MSIATSRSLETIVRCNEPILPKCVLHCRLTTRSAANAAYADERAAGVKIQSVCRGHRARQALRARRHHAITIQRVIRGHLGRVRVAGLMAAALAASLCRRRDAAATHIQSVARGVQSRAHRLDFYARKAHLAAVGAAGEAVLLRMEAHLEATAVAARLAEEGDAVERARRLPHHLVSTAVQRGVFNPPPLCFRVGGGTAATSAPTVNGVPLESVIREASSVSASSSAWTTTARGAQRTSSTSTGRSGGGQTPTYLTTGLDNNDLDVGIEAGAACSTTRRGNSKGKPFSSSPSFGINGNGPLTLTRPGASVFAYLVDARRSLRVGAPYGAVAAAKSEERRAELRERLDTTTPFLAGGTALATSLAFSIDGTRTRALQSEDPYTVCPITAGGTQSRRDARGGPGWVGTTATSTAASTNTSARSTTDRGVTNSTPAGSGGTSTTFLAPPRKSGRLFDDLARGAHLQVM